MRQSQGQYTDFADRMIRAVHGKSRYGQASETTDFDTLISKSQEAFTLLLYENGYNNWVWASRNNQATSSDSGSDTGGNTTDSRCPGYGYTERGKDTLSSRNGGWSRKGMERFNELYRRVREDRMADEGAFERVYRRHREVKSRTRKKRKRGSEYPLQVLTISDDLGELLNRVGSDDDVTPKLEPL
jgi:hypothetical protein